MRILGAKVKFSVGHEKFNFPPLYAEIASSGRIPVVFFAIETMIAVDLKRYHAWIILTRKNGFNKDKCEDLSADRCFLLSMPYFFVFAGAAGTFLLGCWAWYCHKFLQKQRHLVTSVPSPSRSWNRRYLLKHSQMLTRKLIVWLQDNDRDSSFIGSLKALITNEKDWSYLVLTRLCTSSTLACRRTQPACAFTRTASSALSNSFSRASAFTLSDNLT